MYANLCPYTNVMDNLPSSTLMSIRIPPVLIRLYIIASQNMFELIWKPR